MHVSKTPWPQAFCAGDRHDESAMSRTDHCAPASSPQLEKPLPGWQWTAVAQSGALTERGSGVRFDWRAAPAGALQPAFVVRVDGVPRAFVNACRHVAVELDWPHGRFFDGQGLYLTCATHGAQYDPVSGVCVAGPCRGKALAALESAEADGWVWILSASKDR
jgi:nitrite reductase/ring-hydroxylating ferredoxin subunit